MDLRDIIVWLGLIAIVVIVWDGLRRMKGRGLAATKRKPKDQEPYIDPEEAAKKAQIARELPNGGARVREMTETEQQEVQSRLNLRERVPMLMERVQVASESAADDEADEPDRSLQAELDFTSESSESFEPETGEGQTSDDLSFSAVDDGFVDVGETPATETDESEPEKDVPGKVSAQPVGDDAEATETPEADNEAIEETVTETPNVTEAVRETSTEDDEEPAPPLGPVEDLVVVHVMARRDEEFSGSSVLDLLLTAGLRHGPMDIFHYRNPKGVTEFSLANCVQPGTFDPDAMNQVNTPGVTLFMQLPNGADAIEAFEHMFEMARFLAQHLEGELLDEDHSSVTPQRVEYYREKIRSFERTRLIPS